jgi:hypothetical protein
MPLTRDEREFLDAYVYEATSGPPFGGPATQDLGQRGIWYQHLSWILTAYQRELSAEGTPSTGKHNPSPPASPWATLEQVHTRNQELRDEYEVPAKPSISLEATVG